MATRKIKDYAGNEIGELTLPDSTTESEWQERLASYILTPAQILNSQIEFSVSDRRRFAEKTIEKFKQENIKNGINLIQAIHLHDLMRNMQVSFMGKNFTIDLMNLVVSGDLEVAVICLSYMTNLDDGSQPEHWFTAGRRDWIVAELKSYLGWS